MSEHAIVHVDIPSRDRKASGEFYNGLFGWEFNDHPEMNYATFTAAEGPGGGFAPIDDHTMKPGQVLIHVSTDDIEASLAKVEELGGVTLVPKTEIPGIGWYAIFSDPFGNSIGLYTDDPSLQG